MKHKSPSRYHVEYTNIHGIATVPVEATNNELFGWINGSWGSTTDFGKVQDTPQIDCTTRDEKENANNNSDGKNGRLVGEDQERYKDRYGSRNKQCENEVLQEK
jgi:hypothetical protein